MNKLINEMNAEKKLIQRVSGKYDFKVYNSIKVRSAYKVETDKGTICLKKIRHGKKKIDNGHLLVKGLIDNNFSNVAKYIPAKDGNLFVNIKKAFFYATEWINGKEVERI
jgi:Ser/Thr protein kinase RdoA (MazF antagonist)